MYPGQVYITLVAPGYLSIHVYMVHILKDTPCMSDHCRPGSARRNDSAEVQLADSAGWMLSAEAHGILSLRCRLAFAWRKPRGHAECARARARCRGCQRTCISWLRCRSQVRSPAQDGGKAEAAHAHLSARQTKIRQPQKQSIGTSTRERQGVVGKP